MVNKSVLKFSGLNTFEFVQSKADCYCGLRTIKKRLQEIMECAKCIHEFKEIECSGDTEKINNFNSLYGFSKTFRNIINKEYYHDNMQLNFTEQKIKNKFGKIIHKFLNKIADSEINVCELCHQLNSNSEMATITKETVEKHGKSVTIKKKKLIFLVFKNIF